MDTKVSMRRILADILQIILLLQASRVEAGSYCQYDYPLFFYTSRYCTYGCCGSIYSDYSDVCCSYSYTYKSSSSTSSDAPVGVIVGGVIAGLAGLAFLTGLIVCCCVAANNSSRRTGIVLQPANMNVQASVANTTTLSQGQSDIPFQQEAVGYGYPSGGPLPPYGQDNNVAQGYADSANPPPPAAIY